MQIQIALEQLGYSHNEIKVYLALLQLGEGTVTNIARKTSLPRSTTGLVVEELEKKGLLSCFIKKSHLVWLAENPSRFLTDLHEKELILSKLIPELQAIKREAKVQPLLKYFSGINNIRHIFEEVLVSKYPVQMIGSVDHMTEYLNQIIVEDFLQNLFGQLAMVQLITSSSDFVSKLQKIEQYNKVRVKINNDPSLNRVVYIIFNKHVALILLNRKESVGVLFEDSGLAESMTLFFSRLWEDC